MTDVPATPETPPDSIFGPATSTAVVPRGPGRPSKFTPEVRDKILYALRGGNYPSVACEYAGVGYSTFRVWMRRAEEPGAPPEYVEFLEAVKEAAATAEVADLLMVRRAGQGGDWRAAAWMLERRNPQRWGRHDKAEVAITGADGGPVDLRVTAAGADTTAIETLAARLARRAMAVEASGAEQGDVLYEDSLGVGERITPGTLPVGSTGRVPRPEPEVES